MGSGVSGETSGCALGSGLGCGLNRGRGELRCGGARLRVTPGSGTNGLSGASLRKGTG